MQKYDIAFFNLGPWEILLILIVILILFGTKKLPEVARGLGKGINEFRDAVVFSHKNSRARTGEPLKEKSLGYSPNSLYLKNLIIQYFINNYLKLSQDKRIIAFA